MITVTSPGLRTTFQDAGRPGFEHLGVPTSGPADPFAHALANALVRNPAAAACLEVVGHGPSLRIERATTLAYVGAPADLRVNGRAVPNGHTLVVDRGDEVSVGALREGCYGYLAVAGGFVVGSTMGSVSTCSLSGLGPEPLTAGDVVGAADGVRREFRATRWVPQRGGVLRYLRSPLRDVEPSVAAAFDAAVWAVSADVSRVGVRLDGQRLPAPGPVATTGMPTGAIQLPPSGNPIVLGPDHGTTGGYPVVGVVLPGDLAALMQAVPGTSVRFEQVSVEQARTVERARAAQVSCCVFRLDRV